MDDALKETEHEQLLIVFYFEFIKMGGIIRGKNNAINKQKTRLFVVGVHMQVKTSSIIDPQQEKLKPKLKDIRFLFASVVLRSSFYTKHFSGGVN